MEICNVFDTARAFRSMMKSVTSSDPCLVSFDYLASNLCGAKTNKYFQVAEWRLRPLPKVMVKYSRGDSHYLIYIYAVLIELLTTSNNVRICKQVSDEHENWLNERINNPKKWKAVYKDYCKKVNKFMVICFNCSSLI